MKIPAMMRMRQSVNYRARFWPRAVVIGGLCGLGLAFAMHVQAQEPEPSAVCSEVTFEEKSLSVCRARAGQDVRVFHSNKQGEPLGSFAALEQELVRQDPRARLLFAMNGGMYRADLQPLGLYIEKSHQSRPIVLRSGPGNFGLVPNGVFCVTPLRFYVMESQSYQHHRPDCHYATQSGPMLVVEEALHPRFFPESQSLELRNGVGVSADGQEAFFVMANDPINFHSFARFFRDVLQVPNALYLDGGISRLYAPELGRYDWGLPIGPMLGLVAQDTEK